MFAEKAASIDSTSSVAMAEVGFQNLIKGRIKVSLRLKTSQNVHVYLIFLLLGSPTLLQNSN